MLRFLVVTLAISLSTLSAPAAAAEWPSPTPAGLKQVDATPTSVSLTWKPVSKAARYRLQISTSSSMAGATFERSRDTAETLPDLEPGRSYYVKVRVITDDGVNRSAYSDAIRARTAEPASGGSTALTIASFNVRCANCFKHQNLERPWTERRGVVVSSILKQKPDVVGIQEASQGWLRSGGEKISLSQFEDLRNRLRSGGTPYDVTNAHRNNCVKSTTPSGCRYKDQGASQGTRIFYNSATVRLVSQGSQKLPGCSGCNARYVAWAVLEQKSTSERFFFADTHIEHGAKYYNLRRSQTKAMMDEVQLRRPRGIPAFVVGDLNSTRYATPANAPYDEIVKHGFVDPLGHTYKSPRISSKATAEKRIRANYNSHNNFLRSVKHYASNENGSNLDYIFTTPMRTLSWETVLNLDSSGKLAGVIPSDHNMLVAKVLLP